MAKLTVDNLGIEVSTRYAQDQVDYDKSIITDARTAIQTQIDVTSPSQISELDLLLNTGGTKVTPWGSFQPPPNFFSQRKGLFTHQICPSMGTSDKQEALIGRIEASAVSAAAPLAAEHENEKNILLQLFQTTEPLDKDLSRANSERNRYHKG